MLVAILVIILIIISAALIILYKHHSTNKHIRCDRTPSSPLLSLSRVERQWRGAPLVLAMTDVHLNECLQMLAADVHSILALTRVCRQWYVKITNNQMIWSYLYHYHGTSCRRAYRSAPFRRPDGTYLGFDAPNNNNNDNDYAASSSLIWNVATDAITPMMMSEVKRLSDGLPSSLLSSIPSSTSASTSLYYYRYQSRCYLNNEWHRPSRSRISQSSKLHHQTASSSLPSSPSTNEFQHQWRQCKAHGVHVANTRCSNTVLFLSSNINDSIVAKTKGRNDKKNNHRQSGSHASNAQNQTEIKMVQ
jgi:hypothetical protein